MEIADSARKHGVADEDMLHAYRNAIRSIPQLGEDRVLYIGLDRAGRDWLEIGVLGPYNDEPCIIHAKTARDKFLRRLKR